MNTISSQTQAELLGLFSTSFEKIFQHMLPSQKEKLLRLAPTIFNKWYYTVLLEETSLSPARILEYNTKENTTIKGISLFIDLNNEGLSKYQFQTNYYSLENHPIINDLKQLVEYCIPDMEIGENNFFSIKQIDSIAKQCSNTDVFYFHYLTAIAYQLKLIVPLSSIYSKKVQASFDYESFFSQTTEECLKEIFHATIDIAIEKTIFALDFKKGALSHESFLSLIKESHNLDDILINLYQMQNIDFEKFWDIPDDKPLSPEEAAIFSSTFYLGILLEKWLFTPLTSYLKLFFPIYAIPYDFKTILNTLCTMLLADNDTSIELFSPCTGYALNYLGKLLFSEDTISPLEKEISNLRELLPAVFKQIKLREKNNFSKNQCIDFPYSNITYLLKITLYEQEEYWKVIEVEEEASLMVALCEFRIDFEQADVNQLEITIKSNSIEYQESFQKNIFGVPLKTLSLSPKKKIYITPLYDKKSKLKIEFLRKDTINDSVIYPRILEQSTAFTKEEKSYDIF